MGFLMRDGGNIKEHTREFDCSECGAESKEYIRNGHKEVRPDDKGRKKEYLVLKCENGHKNYFEEMPERGRGTFDPKPYPATKEVGEAKIIEGLPTFRPSDIGEKICKREIYKKLREEYPDLSEDQYDILAEETYQKMKEEEEDEQSREEAEMDEEESFPPE